MPASDSLPLAQIRFMRLVFFWGVALIHFLTPTERVTRWLPLNGPLLYDWIPPLFFQFEFLFAFKLAFLLSCIVSGFDRYHHVFAPLAALSGFGYLLLCYAGGMANHQNHLPLLIVWLFAAQTLFARHISTGQMLFLMRLSYCLVFFTAGLTKVVELGWGWFSGDLHMSYLLINRYSYFLPLAPDEIDLNLLFIRHFEYLKPLFFGALFLELAAPLALYRRFRFLVLLLLVMQVLAAKVLYAAFIPYIPVYVIWVSAGSQFEFGEKAATRLFAHLRRMLHQQT